MRRGVEGERRGSVMAPVGRSWKNCASSSGLSTRSVKNCWNFSGSSRQRGEELCHR